MKHTKNTKSFASRWGFILASVGSAVGMANVWGFPNKLGSNGGGAFLLIYLLFVFIFSYVGLPAEFAMGRRAATGTLGAYENAWATRGRSAGKAGGLLGWLPLAGSMCIAIGYAVIVTYILKALADSLLGTLMTADAAAWFGAFSGTPYSVIPYHIVVVVGTLLTLFLGAHIIEKTNKVMMPLFFLIFLVLAVRSSLQNMFEAVAESLMHKFPRLSRTAVLVILCVVCLGFGIGMETIDKWGPWMDLVSIYIIPIGATLGAISWFYVMKKDELLDAVNTGSGKLRGNLWYSVGRYVYVPLAVILCCVALFMHVAF